MGKSICTIPHCSKVSFCKGYCRNHYNSHTRHGDPLHAERFMEQRRLQSEEKKKLNATKPKRESNVGKICKVDGCLNPAKIKGYCPKHDIRIKRNGTLVPKIKRSTIKVDECLVLGCVAQPKTHGICKNHLVIIKELKTPLKPKIIKLCGVKGCENKHLAKGMCNTHYVQWKDVIREYNLSEYVSLSGYECDE